MASMHLMSLRWDLLDLTPVAEEKLSVRLANPDVRKDVFIAIDSSRKRYVLVAIPHGEPCELSERISVGIAVRVVDMKVDDGEIRNFVEVICLDPQGHAALDVAVTEISEALNSGASIGCVRIVQNVLEKWRRFWAGAKQDLLSREQQIGLFGELWFLLNWLIPSIGFSKSIDMWRGPLGARNDFEILGVGIEVKTSSKESASHVINGVDQLLEPAGGSLFLFSLVVREEGSGKESLPDLVNKVRSFLNDDLLMLSRFESLLYGAGYDSVCEFEYRKLSLRIRSEELFRVAEGFPRITATSFIGGVPAGVGSVKYDLNLAGAAKWRVANNPASAKTLLVDFLEK